MERKFNRIESFVDSIESKELPENQQIMLMAGTGTIEESLPAGNNCRCNSNDCKCSGDNCNCNTSALCK